MDAEGQRDVMCQKIRESQRCAEGEVIRLRRSDTRFVYTSLVASSLGTIVAGLAAAFGPVLGKDLPGWKLTCAAVAGLTACSTLLSGIHKQLTIPDRLGKANACVLKLRALEIDITLGHRDLAEVAKEFQELAVNYAEFVT